MFEKFLNSGNLYKWFIWIAISVMLIFGTSAYLSYYRNQHQYIEDTRKATLETTKQILEIQQKLERNGELASRVLQEVASNQSSILNMIEKALNEQRLETVSAIHEHQKVSRAMFLEEFSSLRKEHEAVLSMVGSLVGKKIDAK